MVRKCQEIILMVWKCSRNVRNFRKCLGYGQEMAGNGQEMSVNGQELVRNFSGNVRKWSANAKKWSEIIRILSKIDKQTKKRGEIHLVYVQPERRRREGLQQKKETLNHPPHFYCSIFFLCSFLFFLFKSFHMAR